MGNLKCPERTEKGSIAQTWEVDVPIMKLLTGVLKFIQNGITMGKRYSLQNATVKKDALDKEMMAGTYVL